MAKRFGTREDLEHLVLQDLRAHPACGSAVAVTIRRLRSPERNWEISTFDPGTSDPSACKEALQQVYSKRVAAFDLIGKA
jgi:hypothetical protein